MAKIPQAPEIDLDQPIQHGESIVLATDEITGQKAYLDDLDFMEEPVMVSVATTTGHSKFPETYVPIQVNGKGAEVQQENGKWISMTWIPVNRPLVLKRKYVEVLLRSRSDEVQTEHDDGNVEKPMNRVIRQTAEKYPVSILKDSAKGQDWAARIRANR